MDTSEINLEEISKYINYVNTVYQIDKVMVFGSYAKKTATKDSDIDLAIISKQLGKRPLLEAMELYKMRHRSGTELNIQPHCFGFDEFNNVVNFFIAEIAKTGIDITREVLGGSRQ